MTPREQLVSAIVGVVNVPVTVVYALASHKQTALILAIGLVASVATVAAARWGNRLAGAIALIGCALFHQTDAKGTGAQVLAFAGILPFYGVAMWMVLNQNRAARELGVARRAARKDGAPASNRPRAHARGGAATSSKGAPPRSKRYTPPKAKGRAR
jgi:hypothetical protein